MHGCAKVLRGTRTQVHMGRQRMHAADGHRRHRPHSIHPARVEPFLTFHVVLSHRVKASKPAHGHMKFKNFTTFREKVICTDILKDQEGTLRIL